MKKIVLKNLMLLFLISASSLTFAQTWETITTDASGDGADGALMDGTELEYRYNESEDSLWFRLTCTGISAAQATNVGFNIMVNYPDGGSTFNFWGWDNGNPFHRLVTGWVTGTPPSSYSGTIGIANSSGVAGSVYDNLHSDNLTIIVNPIDATITVGMLRSDLIPDEALNTEIVTAAAVGASTSWNDDIYSASGTMTLVSTAGISEDEYASKQITLYPNPTKNVVFINWTDEVVNASYNVEITDLTGKTILQQNIQSNMIDVSELPSGIYIVKIISEQMKEAAVSRFIKE